MTCPNSVIIPANKFPTLNRRINWGIEMLEIPDIWEVSKGEGINIAVLDSGIAFNHPDFINAITDMKDFTGSKAGVYDISGHGTHVAGIICSKNPKVGVAPESSLLVGKIINDEGVGDVDVTVEAIYWAVKNKVDIINLSIESKNNYPQLKEAVEFAKNMGCIVVCSAGNAGPKKNSVQYPAVYQSTIAVGALDKNCKLRFDASTGSHLDIVAPGIDIYSTAVPYGYVTRGGSSMAAPFVSGVIALALSRHRQVPTNQSTINTPDGMRNYLRSTALKLGNTHDEELYGSGLIHPKCMIV